MTPEREKELLGLIEAYWRIRLPKSEIHVTEREETDRTINKPTVYIEDRQRILRDGYGIFGASWAESEACLREVVGECFAQEAYRVEIGKHPDDAHPDARGLFFAEIHCLLGEKRYADDVSCPVALLRAFVAAFGSEPRHE